MSTTTNELKRKEKEMINNYSYLMQGEKYIYSSSQIPVLSHIIVKIQEWEKLKSSLPKLAKNFANEHFD